MACPTVRIEAPLSGKSPAPCGWAAVTFRLFDAILQNTDLLSNAAFTGVSIPVGLTRAGLPAGLALDAPAGGDALVLGVAMAFEDIIEPAASGHGNRSIRSGPVRRERTGSRQGRTILPAMTLS